MQEHAKNAETEDIILRKHAKTKCIPQKFDRKFAMWFMPQMSLTCKSTIAKHANAVFPHFPACPAIFPDFHSEWRKRPITQSGVFQLPVVVGVPEASLSCFRKELLYAWTLPARSFCDLGKKRVYIWAGVIPNSGLQIRLFLFSTMSWEIPYIKKVAIVSNDTFSPRFVRKDIVQESIIYKIYINFELQYKQ